MSIEKSFLNILAIAQKALPDVYENTPYHTALMEIIRITKEAIENNSTPIDLNN